MEHKPLADRTSVALAGTLLNHYRIEGPIDLAATARYLKRIAPGQGGDVVGDLGDVKDHLPALREEVRRLEREIQRLRHKKPHGWADLSNRYADAIVGLKEVIATAEKPGKRRK